MVDENAGGVMSDVQGWRVVHALGAGSANAAKRCAPRGSHH